MDRRSVQISPHSRIVKDRCIHTKNVFSLIDLYPSEESYHKIKTHMNECRVCEDVYKKFELESLEVKIHIPKPQIDSETKEVFSNEIHELFKTFELNEKEKLRKKIKKNMKRIDLVGADFIKNLGSKNMLTTYAFGVVLFIVLKQFFN